MLEENVALSDCGIEGRARVELRDAVTGKLVDCQEGTNFITQGVSALQRIAQRFLFAAQNPLQLDFMPFADLTFTEGASIFHTMYLTDSSLAEAPATERIVPGTVIGFSTRQTHSDTETRRGIINRAESWANPSQVRFVMDWATDRGNGTFQSICWARANAGLSPLHTFPFPRFSAFRDPVFRLNLRATIQQGITEGGGSLWGHRIDTSSAVISRYHPTTGALELTRTLPTAVFAGLGAMAVIGDNLYFIDTGHGLRRHSISANTTTASLASSLVGIVAIGDILYMHTTGTFPAIGASLTLRRYNNATLSFMSDIIIPNFPGWPHPQSPVGHGSMCFLRGNSSGTQLRMLGFSIFTTISFPGSVLVDLDTLSFISDPAVDIIPRGEQLIPFWSFTHDQYAVSHYPTFTQTYDSGGAPSTMGVIYTIGQTPQMNWLASRIRLASPITKTSAHTLKVIYDFNFA